MTEAPFQDPHPSGSGGSHPTGEYPRHVPPDRETRIPPWAANVAAIIAATTAIIGWGEVRFVRRDVYDLAHSQALSELHRQEERIKFHEDKSDNVEKETAIIRDRLARIEVKLDELIKRQGEEVGTKRWR